MTREKRTERVVFGHSKASFRLQISADALSVAVHVLQKLSSLLDAVSDQNLSM